MEGGELLGRVGNLIAQLKEDPGNPSLARQTFWLMIAKFASFVLNVAVPLVVVRLLDQYHFGLYKQSFLVIATAQNLLPMSVGLSAFYFLPRMAGRAREVVFNIVLFHAALGSIVCLALVAWPGLLVLVFNDSSLSPYAPWIGITILLTLFSDFLEIVAVANRDVRLSTVFIIGAQLTKGLFLTLAAALFASVPALLCASALQGLLQCAVLFWYIRFRFPGPLWSFDARLLGEQLRYALPFGVAGLVYRLQMDLHSYVVARQYGAAVFAIYAIGCTQLPLIGILRDSVGTVLISRISQLQAQAAEREILLLVARIMRKLAAVYWPLYAYLIVMGPEFLTVLFTPRYRASWPVFALNLTMLPLNMITVDPILRAYFKHRYFMLRLRLITLPLLGAGLWWSLPRYGMSGAIGTVVAITLLEYAVVVGLVSRILGMRRSDWRLFGDAVKLGLAAAVAAICVAGLHAAAPALPPIAALAVTAPVFGLVYLGAVLLLKIPETEEKAVMWRQLLRLRRALGGAR